MESTEKTEYFATYLILMLMVFLLGFAAGNALSKNTYREEGYKQGQIDCQNGKISVRKEKQPDGSIIWVLDERFEY